MLFHHLFQEKMTVWKQVRFRNPPFSYGSQALFSTIFQENQQKFLLLTVFWWCDDSRNPPWLEWRHFFYIKLQKYNSKIGWQAGGFQISSRRIWWLRCSNILQQVCEWMNKHVDFYHFVEYVLHWIWYLIVRLGIFNYIIAWKWCARKDVWKNRFQMATNNEAAPCGKKSDKNPCWCTKKGLPWLVGKSHILNRQDIFQKDVHLPSLFGYQPVGEAHQRPYVFLNIKSSHFCPFSIRKFSKKYS